MTATIQKDKLPQSVPLPLFDMVRVGSMESNHGEQFTIMIGLDEKLAEELKMKSLDESDADLMENTSDKERFGQGSYEEWYAKSRVPFALIHDATGALAALAWFGPKPLGRKSLKHLSPEELANENEVASNDWHTIVYRSYLPFRGTGLMRDFSQATLDIYTHYFPHAGLWAGVNRKNAASIKLSEKLGFIADETRSEPEWVLMIRK